MKTKLFYLHFFLILSITLPYSSHAQSLSSLPFFIRFPNYTVQHTETSEDEMEFPISDIENILLSGRKGYAQYKFDNEKAGSARQISTSQMMEQYALQMRKLNASLLYAHSKAATYSVPFNSKKYWVAFETFNDGANYCIMVVEHTADQAANVLTALKDGQRAPQLRKYISAKELFEEINQHGKVTLNINFESGKFDLPQESQASVGEIAKLMQKLKNLEISIEGHTDDVGSTETNKQISEKRAISLMNALVNMGIPAQRMTAKGWGSEKPVVDNSSEEHRLLNRRVEIIRVNKSQ